MCCGGHDTGILPFVGGIARKPIQTFDDRCELGIIASVPYGGRMQHVRSLRFGLERCLDVHCCC